MEVKREMNHCITPGCTEKKDNGENVLLTRFKARKGPRIIFGFGLPRCTARAYLSRVANLTCHYTIQSAPLITHVD
jgi:hypothetical protein